jgi:transporter family protein
MAAWFWYAVVAAVLYGAHQIFTRMAAERIGEGLGGFIVEGNAALSILIYLAIVWLGGRWNQEFSGAGFYYSLLTGICVGAGTIAFFLLFQKGGPLSSVPAPAVLAGGAAIMGHCWHLIFPRGTIMAANRWRCIRHPRFVFATQIESVSEAAKLRGLTRNSAHRFNGRYDLRAIFWPFVQLLPSSR